MKISNKIKSLVAAAVIAVSTLGMAVPTFAVNCPQNSLRPGASVDSYAACNVEADPTGGDLISRLKVIINVVIGIVGFVAVVMIIIGGISYTISAGDSAKVKKAMDTIKYGIIGLIIALLAFAIVNFVLTSIFATA